MRFNHLATFAASSTLVLALAACAAPSATTTPVIAMRETSVPITQDMPTPIAQDNTQAPTEIVIQDLLREDTQGAVSVDVIPMNLDTSGDTLDFEVAMNTHSVDLSMDLVTLATLESDTGLSVTPANWNGPRGGHHVTGILSFPASMDGEPLREGARRLTLTIRDVDVPERVFVWELAQ